VTATSIYVLFGCSIVGVIAMMWCNCILGSVLRIWVFLFFDLPIIVGRPYSVFSSVFFFVGVGFSNLCLYLSIFLYIYIYIYIYIYTRYSSPWWCCFYRVVAVLCLCLSVSLRKKGFVIAEVRNNVRTCGRWTYPEAWEIAYRGTSLLLLLR
jgi:hypothetical protein